MVRGTVKRISSNVYKGTRLYSIMLDGVDGFYNTGQIYPANIGEGDYVEFEATPGKREGSFQVDVGTIRKLEASVQTAPPVAKPAAGSSGGGWKGRKSSGGGFSGGGAKDDYWLKREERDIATQATIELQSCRNSALELVKLMLQAEALKLPAVAKREEFIAELVNRYTKQFLAENNGDTLDEVEVGDPTEEAVDNDDVVGWE